MAKAKTMPIKSAAPVTANIQPLARAYTSAARSADALPPLKLYFERASSAMMASSIVMLPSPSLTSAASCCLRSRPSPTTRC